MVTMAGGRAIRRRGLTTDRSMHRGRSRGRRDELGATLRWISVSSGEVKPRPCRLADLGEDPVMRDELADHPLPPGSIIGAGLGGHNHGQDSRSSTWYSISTRPCHAVIDACSDARRPRVFAAAPRPEAGETMASPVSPRPIPHQPSGLAVTHQPPPVLRNRDSRLSGTSVTDAGQVGSKQFAYSAAEPLPCTLSPA